MTSRWFRAVVLLAALQLLQNATLANGVLVSDATK